MVVEPINKSSDHSTTSRIKHWSNNMKRVALYLRVSTHEQTTENQELELRSVAARMNWSIVKVYCDHGVSGAMRIAAPSRPMGLDVLVSAGLEGSPAYGLRTLVDRINALETKPP